MKTATITSTQEFEAFVAEVNSYHNMVRGKLVDFTHFTCQHCYAKVETVKPTLNMVPDKGYWDGPKRCTKCGRRSFVAVYTSGQTLSIKID